MRKHNVLQNSSKLLIASNDVVQIANDSVQQSDNEESAPSDQKSISIGETYATLESTASNLHKFVFIVCMFGYLVTNVLMTVYFAYIAKKLPARERDKDVAMYGQGKDWYPFGNMQS